MSLHFGRYKVGTTFNLSQFPNTFLIVLIAASIKGWGQQTQTYDPVDLATLNSLPTKWQQYWNTHDMDGMGTMLREDVDFINVAGVWLKGKSATISDHKQKHQGIIFKNSVWTTDSVRIRYLKPDLALLHIGWGVKGDNDPDGTPRAPRHGLFTWLVSKEKTGWQLIAAQNVNIREAAAPVK